MKNTIITSFLLFLTTVLISQNPSTEWKYNLGKNYLTTAVVIENDVIYAGNEDGLMVAIDASKGKMLWKFQASGGIGQAPLVNNGIVYFGSKGGFVYALHAATGNEKWLFSAGEKVICLPVLYKDLVIVFTKSKLIGLDKEVGLDMWNTPIKITASPVMEVSGDVLCFSDDMSVYAFEAKSGKKLWQFALPVYGSSDVVCNESKAFFVNGAQVFAIDLNTGKDIWKRKLEYETKPKTYNKPALNGSLLLISYLSDVLAFEEAKGVLTWEYKSKSELELSTAVINESIIYVPEKGNKIYSISIEKGKKLEIYTMPDKMDTPVLVNSTTVFYSNFEGNIVRGRLK